jgi:putative tryptophan/tyrosine transport system substrate-binding protein
MKRRTFITLLGGAAAAWPLAARAQQPRKLPTIGFMGAATPSAWSDWVAVFVQRLRDLGWIEGRTVAIEYRWAEGRRDRLIEIAAEFVKIKVDVIFAPVTVAALAAREATSIIPIVFALVGEPVATGLVASLARPGGNVTGTSNQSTDLGSKRLEILREVVPGLRRLAILVNVGNPANVIEVSRIRAVAEMLGLEVTTLEVRRSSDIAPSFEALGGQVDALYVTPDAFIFTNLTRINAFVLAAKLPTMHGSKEYVEAGGLMSYGPTNLDQFRRAAEYVDSILKGSKPADLPVAQPTRFNLAINLNTAKAIGLTVPPLLIARADEVIE